MLLTSEPGLVEDVVRPLREIATFAVFAAVTFRLAQRIHLATRPLRRTLGPVLAVACFRCGAFCGLLVGRRLAPESQVVEVSMWLLAITVPLVAVAFLVGLARWWLFMAAATQRLAHRLRGHPSPEDLQRALADVFDDPDLVVVYRADDGRGRPFERPSVASGRSLTEVRDGDRLVAAIVHDAALGQDEAFLDIANSYALMTLDNHRLSVESRSLLDEVQQARVRIQTAADDERQRIERDLHDGAQQRLVALAIHLDLAAERTSDAEGAAVLRRFATDVEAALAEIRSLASGSSPATLADRGLVEGLRSATAGNALRTTVLAAGIRRYSHEVESAAYFCCLEALQNAAKHARGATAAVVYLSDDGTLHLEVRDDGEGFDQGAVDAGSGLVNMRDRLAAVGGELAIESLPGHGTCVQASIPLGADAPGLQTGETADAGP